MGILRREKVILVATMDQKLTCYNSKGKKIMVRTVSKVNHMVILNSGKKCWDLSMPDSILCLEAVDIQARGSQFTAVALKNKQVLLFDDKHLVDFFSLNDSVK